MEPSEFYDPYTNTQNLNRDLLKRKMTLDFDNKTSVIKKTKLQNPSLQTPVFQKTEILSSPDFHKLDLASPELERLILHQASLPTPTPLHPNQQTVFFPKTVTEEQENYAKGFHEALAQLQNQNQLNYYPQQQQQQQNFSNNTTDTDSSDESDSNSGSMTSSNSYTTNGSNIYNNTIVKEEPQTVPQNINPIDMVSQEKIKLERKRQRNRIAASKCRKRKLERISKLEDKVKQIKMENQDLISVSQRLRDQVVELKKEVMKHVQLGCEIMVSDGMGF